MNKVEFVKLVKETGNYKSQDEAEAAISAVSEAITAGMISGETVNIVGFGAFHKTLQKGKSGKVPGTDKTYQTQDKMVPKFKAAKALKERISTGKV